MCEAHNDNVHTDYTPAYLTTSTDTKLIVSRLRKETAASFLAMLTRFPGPNDATLVPAQPAMKDGTVHLP